MTDVSIEGHYIRFRDELIEQQKTDKIHLLFNNAGIGGGGSMIADSRAQWERTFNICWGGVYLGVRTFLPLLLEADEGHIVNTSSVNGFWASGGMGRPHTAYSAAKFAVKGFSEALINDLRLHVLDLWFERVVKSRLRGEARLVRYIDDFVICFQYRSDAIRVQDALRFRLGKFDLTLEPTKTKLVEFGRFAQRHAGKRGRRRPETIYFLGLTLYCTRNQKVTSRLGCAPRNLAYGAALRLCRS